jgi:hypothetical protein
MASSSSTTSATHTTPACDFVFAYPKHGSKLDVGRYANELSNALAKAGSRTT